MAPLMFSDLTAGSCAKQGFCYQCLDGKGRGAIFSSGLHDEKVGLLWRGFDKRTGYTRPAFQAFLALPQLCGALCSWPCFRSPLAMICESLDCWSGYDTCWRATDSGPFSCPPCATFSPVAHPAVRSYAEPKGWDRLSPKSSSWKHYGFQQTRRHHRPGALEGQKWPGFTMEAFKEAVVASCAFGSIHQKEFEFRLLVIYLGAVSLRAHCSRVVRVCGVCTGCCQTSTLPLIFQA